MSVQLAYQFWSEIYDSNENKTRDLEGVCMRAILQEISFSNCLEIGCGTGKNTVWLETKAQHVTAVDLTPAMIEKAKQKVQTKKVTFEIADINQDWNFAKEKYDLVTFSLVLEHIENLIPIFEKLSNCIKPNGYVYIGELHPFKQYAGSKARFDNGSGEEVVECYNHHISDSINAASKYGFELKLLNEHFDDNDKTTIPRILTLLFQNKL
jgi:2-polyprenyl-3-methyl-5-hydroxy-6-metoxy-1,4-benzoquinol methylase